MLTKCVVIKKYKITVVWYEFNPVLMAALLECLQLK